MGLSKIMLASLAEAEYIDPTPIQAGLIPRALEGIDLMGQAQTGTGKTAAFVLAMLSRVDTSKPYPQVKLVLKSYYPICIIYLSLCVFERYSSKLQLNSYCRFCAFRRLTSLPFKPEKLRAGCLNLRRN